MNSAPARLRVLRPSDPEWARAFENLPVNQKDVFYSPGYADIAARFIHRGAEARGAIYEKDGAFVLYPFLERELDALLGNEGVRTGYRDITGLYGRGGVVSNAPEQTELFRQFYDDLSVYSQENKVICGFDRYHPVLQNHRQAAPETRLIDVGGFIVLDMRPPLVSIEQAYRHAARKNIKKAERANIRIIEENTTEHLDQFLAVYSATMQRRSAGAFYNIDPEFYRQIEQKLPGRFRFFYALLDGKAVSAELVLYEGIYCHSFLGGTLEAYLEVCPNHLLKRDLIRSMRSAGCQYYLLGGGPKPYDGIWNYKRCFAEEGNIPSWVGGTVFDQKAYAALKETLVRKGMDASTARFQFYDRS